MHAAEAIISTEGRFNHIQPNASEGFAFKDARVLVAAKNSAKLFFFQVQSRRTDPACVAQKHPTLHHSLEKRRFDSCFLSQLDGSYLFFYFFSKPKQQELETYGVMEQNQNDPLCSQSSKEHSLQHAFLFIY